jgi:SAM-dependent methyltransferase
MTESTSPFIIDLGCGTAKEPGAIGVDNVDLPAVDVVHDLLDFPYPFDDNCAHKIYLKHVIEHFTLGDINRILNEVHRLLQPNGIVEIRVPHVFSVAAWVDPTHRSAFAFGSVSFFEIGSAKAYYRETDSIWSLVETTSDVTGFNWKRYRMRQIDSWFSRWIKHWLNWLLRQPNLPGSADLLVKTLPLFFVEIRWKLCKEQPDKDHGSE